MSRNIDAATPGSVAPLTTVLDALVGELERETQWLEELRSDAEKTSRSCQRLLNAIDATMQALPRAGRMPYWVRVKRLHAGLLGLGRPPVDGRQKAILQFIAERGSGIFTNVEVRQHLIQAGLEARPKYVSNQLRAYAEQGMLTRVSRGTYSIEVESTPFLRARFRLVRNPSSDCPGPVA